MYAIRSYYGQAGYADKEGKCQDAGDYQVDHRRRRRRFAHDLKNRAWRDLPAEKSEEKSSYNFV